MILLLNKLINIIDIVNIHKIKQNIQIIKSSLKLKPIINIT